MKQNKTQPISVGFVSYRSLFLTFLVLLQKMENYKKKKIIFGLQQ
jgi:hypothetical protein